MGLFFFFFFFFWRDAGEEKKAHTLFHDSRIPTTQQINKIDSTENLTPAEVLNKMYELGYQRGMIMGKRDILIEIALMIKLDDSIVDDKI